MARYRLSGKEKAGEFAGRIVAPTIWLRSPSGLLAGYLPHGTPVRVLERWNGKAMISGERDGLTQTGWVSESFLEEYVAA